MVRKLNRREKIIVYAAAGFLGLFIIIQFGIVPLMEKRSRLMRGIEVKAIVLEQITALRAEYEAMRSQEDMALERYENRSPDFTLFAFMDQLAGETRIKDHIEYMKPAKTEQKDSPYKISQVEMKLQNITLKQLATYLFRIEASDQMVSVKRMSITKKGKNEKFVDWVLQVETLEL
ncbi:MAG: hypothetical protein PHW17_00630 [Desulfobacterales bacterium]|nr:hypothetical protein [Desulfobacterales bacterium]MDD4462729.1 hypothetical protein [Desulfobacterales bacterium]